MFFVLIMLIMCINNWSSLYAQHKLTLVMCNLLYTGVLCLIIPHGVTGRWRERFLKINEQAIYSADAYQIQSHGSSV